MRAENLYLVSHKRMPVADGDIEALKSARGFTFPDDLCNFLRQFGPGEYCGCLFLGRPKDLLEGQPFLRQVFRESFFFDREKSALSQEEVLESTWVARGLDGDEIVYRPTGKTGFYVLPRQSDIILKVGNTFDEVLEWFSSAGVIYAPSKIKWFCPFKDRCRLHLVGKELISHFELLSLVENAFNIDRTETDFDNEIATLFSREISGYIHVYQNHIDIHHDLDFDAQVCKAAEEFFFKRGFKTVEHHLPQTAP